MSEMTRKDRNDKASKMKRFMDMSKKPKGDDPDIKMKRFMDMSKKPNGDGCCVQGKTRGKMR